MTKFRVETEQPLGSGTTFDVFKCVIICCRHCQIGDRGQFIVLFDYKVVLYCVLLNYVLFKAKEVD